MNIRIKSSFETHNLVYIHSATNVTMKKLVDKFAPFSKPITKIDIKVKYSNTTDSFH
jgi:hypothetical protein